MRSTCDIFVVCSSLKFLSHFMGLSGWWSNGCVFRQEKRSSWVRFTQTHVSALLPLLPSPQTDFTLCGVKVGHCWNLITYQRLSQDKMPDLMVFVLSKRLLQGSRSSRSSQSRGATSPPFIFELQLEWQTQKMPWLSDWEVSTRSAQDKRSML